MSELGVLRWPEVPEPRPLLVVPVGSTEQHGPHLPLDTDTRVAVAIAAGFAAGVAAAGFAAGVAAAGFAAEVAAAGFAAGFAAGGVAAGRPGVLVAPPLPYGASGEHDGFPGTLSLGREALELVLLELVRSADATASGVVLVNGHGGNAVPVRAAVDRLTYEGRRVLAWGPRVPGGDPHAGRWETAVLLHLAPDLVRMELAVAGPRPPLADLVRHGVRRISPTGVLGDPAGASAAEGADLLAGFVADLTAAVERWAPAAGAPVRPAAAVPAADGAPARSDAPARGVR